ncbi:MAG TPA: hypothetical protein VGF21_11950 [Thermoleophilaceae bacterium]|jgi:hypothetical protein
MNTGVRSGLERWAGLGASIYAILFVVASVIAFSGIPDSDARPAKVILYYSQSSHRDKWNWAWALVLFGVFFFIWFLGSLRKLLRETDPDGFLSGLAVIGGTIYATTSLLAFSLEAAIRTMSDDTYQHQVFPELIHAADDAGYVMHSAGGVGIATLMIATSLVTMRAGRIPGWAGWVGIVFGFLAIFSIFFIPQFLIFLWLLVAGVAVFRAGPAAPAQPGVPQVAS